MKRRRKNSPKEKNFVISSFGPDAQRIYLSINGRWIRDRLSAKLYTERDATEIARQFQRTNPSVVAVKIHKPGFIRNHPKRKKSLFGVKRTVIYGRVLRIEAKKTQKHICDHECKNFNHSYFHDFKLGAVMYGLPNGDILIKSER